MNSRAHRFNWQWVAMVLLLLLSMIVRAQDDSLDEAIRLSPNILRLYQAGRYAEAIPLAERVLAIHEKVLGLEHPETAKSVSNLGELYRITGAHARAEPILERALAIREKVLGPDHPDTAESLNNLAGLYQSTGAYAKAEAIFLRTLAINEKIFGHEHPKTATSLSNLALLYQATGAYAKAEPLYQRALAIREKALGANHRDTAASLNNLAELYRLMGAYVKAEPLYRRALAIKEEVLGPMHPSTALSLNNLASLYDAAGAYNEAEPLFLHAMAIREKVLGLEHTDTAASYNNLALHYQVVGAYAKAEPLYQRALAIHERVVGPKHPSTATVLDNLAELYRLTGAYAKAEPLYRRALAIKEEALGLKHPATAFALNNLGSLYLAAGAYADAELLLQRSVSVGEIAFGPEHPNTAASLNNLAELYRHTGAYDKAEPLYRRALAIREEVLGPEHPATATTLNNLAILYGAGGVSGKAEPLYQRALAIREKALGPEHPETATSLNNLATLYQATGAYASAEPLLARAQGIQEANAARFLLSGSESRKQSYIRQGGGQIYANVSFSLTSPTPQAKSLGLTSVLQYKGRVLDAMSGSVARLRRSVAPADRALFDQLSEVAQQYSTLSFGGLGKLGPEAYRQRLDELAREQERLQTELSSRSAALREAITPITLEGVRQALPANAVLIEWFRYRPFDAKAKADARWGEARYVAYVLKRSGEPAAIDLGPAQPIDDLVLTFRTALSDPTTTYYDEVAQELSGKLIKPLLPHVAQSERLLLSPDGALNLLPFAALMDEQGAYLARRFELTYLTSGRDLLHMTNESSAQGNSVVMADPAYGQIPGQGVVADTSLQPARAADLDRSGLVFKPLPGTAAEAKALGSLLKLDAQNVLTGDQATETKLKDLHRPRILHVATHGFFLSDREAATVLKPGGFGTDTPAVSLGENPLLRSGLALAGANARRSGSADDGILTAAEAAQLDLLGTQLVVLSACETGIGKVQTGEGVYGLRRALTLAGAQTQVVSLWKVADTATQELMVDYYQRLLKGEGRSQALRNTQTTMMANPDRQHPYYWAAFVAIGNWAALPGRR